MTELAVYGPPWRTVANPRDILAADPPGPNNCATGHLALAAYSPKLRTLVRETDRKAVEARAYDLAIRGESRAYVLQGVITTGSGRWLWPIATDVVELALADDDELEDEERDPLTRAGFALTVEELHGDLLGSATPAERRAVDAAVDDLDRDWAEMSEGERDIALEAIGVIIAAVALDETFLLEAAGSLEAAAMSVSGASVLGSGGLSRVLSAGDAALARRIGRNGLAFVTNEYRHRSAMWSREARRIIGRDARVGLGRADIARNLHGALRDRVSGRSEWYYRVVGSTAVAQARSFGQLRGMQQAGLDWYVWEAVMDARTCDVCRFLHGQEFPVASSLQRMERALQNPDPEAGVNELPWYRVIGGTQLANGLRSGGQIVVQPRGQPPSAPIATIRTSGVGQNDVRGSFRIITPVLRSGGTPMPPAHGNCRCTINSK
jgi:uncharacterized protein YgfB (UPF0149 family)